MLGGRFRLCEVSTCLAESGAFRIAACAPKKPGGRTDLFLGRAGSGLRLRAFWEFVTVGAPKTAS